MDEVERLTSWCQDNCLSLNVSKTKELIVDFRKRQQRPYTPLMISGTPVERVSSIKYLGVNISEDLTWTTHIQTQVKKARQRLYYLRQMRKFRVSPAILKTFYSGAIESVLTQCISVWYGNSLNPDCKALQRVVRLAECISGSALLSLQDIYLKRCKSRAAKILKDSNHPGNHLFCLLPSGKRFRSMMAKTERLRRSFFPQAIRFLTQAQFHKLFTRLNLLTAKHLYSHHPCCCYVYISGTTRLHIPLAHPCSYYYLLSPSILFCTSYLFCTLYLSLFFYLYLYICSCVVLLVFNVFLSLFFALSIERT